MNVSFRISFENYTDNILLHSYYDDFYFTDGLLCQQCGIRLTSSVNGNNTEKCLDGSSEQKICTNPNHTHCIVNFYREIYINSK